MCYRLAPTSPTLAALALAALASSPPVAPAARPGGSPAGVQQAVERIPLRGGLTIVSTFRSPDGDREDVVEVLSADAGGVRYAWRLLELRARGDTVAAKLERHVRANDLAGAPRLDPIFMSGDDERPGYTAFTLSSAVYTRLRDHGAAAYSVTGVESAGGIVGAVTGAAGGGAMQQRARYKGTLRRVSPAPEPFPLLVDGRRVRVPALRVAGDFASGLRRRGYEFWVLADSAHPLLLKSVTGGNVFQVVRVDFPLEVTAGAATPAARGVAALERELDAACRIELPGVYFAVNTATIDPASDRALAAVARVLARHGDWRLTVEGHTDSVGTARANQALSERRAAAVRARLAERHGVDTRAWQAVGHGATRPREPNATIEGRARNRRVELVRACGGR